MANTAEGLSPLVAYEQLMHFAKRRGEFALRLAMHAAVPQGIHSELLHLLKRNFVPEARDDPTLEADVLFSALCEELGRGYFRFDPQVRTLLLENLAANYSGEGEARISKVGDFLLAYVDHYDRSTTGSQDQLWRDYLEMQRWVAFAFVDPSGAAQQLAVALEGANSSGDFVARIQLGGLASALAAPLAAFPSLLTYAAGLQALELGDRQRAGELFESLHEEELKIGKTTLRATSQILAEWQARHPENVPLMPQAEERPPSKGLEQTIRALKSRDKDVRRFAAQSLGMIYGSDAAVPALIEALEDRNVGVRLAAVEALARIGTPRALIGLTLALHNRSAVVGAKALSWLKQKDQPLALVVGDFTQNKEVASSIQRTLVDTGQLPVFGSFALSDRRFFELAGAAKLAIIDTNYSGSFLEPELDRIIRLSIPVQPIAQGDSNIARRFLDIHRYASLRPIARYDDIADLEYILRKFVHEFSPSKPQPLKDFEYDVYISYSRADRTTSTPGVVDDLHRTLERVLHEFLGREPKIFRDTELAPGAAFEKQLYEAIQKSAIFVVAISPAYLSSTWCMKELTTIVMVERRESSESARIFKVMVRPVALNRQPSIMQGLLGYELFGLEKKRKYPKMLERLAIDIAQTRRAQETAVALDIPELSPSTMSGAEPSTPLERWPVRTGTDEDVGKVNSNIVITTVEELIAIPRPAHLPYVGAGRSKYHSHRSEPVETTIWSLHTTILAYRRTENESYRLILQGQSGATMMAQVPDPKAVGPSSPWIDTFRGVRDKLDELDFVSGYSYPDPPMPVRIVGVGHFGRFHSKTNARNGIALEPILGIHWLDDALPFPQIESVKKRFAKRQKSKKLKPR